MTDIRIFSYLPNPRLYKSTIAARLNGVDIDIVGASPKELSNWLWDFDARPLEQVTDAEKQACERDARTGFSGKLYKTDRFLEANPYGTVPCAFSPDGSIGLFESNSILRAVARLGQERFPLYGNGVFEASRIDAFLDASLVFARDSQIYLLAIGRKVLNGEIHDRAQDAFIAWMSGIEQGLHDRQWLVGKGISAADICFACELALFSRDLAAQDVFESLGRKPVTDLSAFPQASAHYARLCAMDAVSHDLKPYLNRYTNG
ncbi:MAG: glutathione S-transferase family protein [Proteobacteria bacterium]|nr:glutathione S-transferase family protein [Pseudomonadota bacterium]